MRLHIEVNEIMGINEIISEIENLTVLELNELTKAIQEKWDIDTAMMAAPMIAAGAAPAAAAVVEKTKFDVVLKSGGDTKIQVIKVVREIVPNLGLKEAKALVDEAPQTIKEGVSKDEAEQIKQKVEAVGGAVEIK
jgi:large subunit ribosomal protein L7/L12